MRFVPLYGEHCSDSIDGRSQRQRTSKLSLSFTTSALAGCRKTRLYRMMHSSLSWHEYAPESSCQQVWLLKHIQQRLATFLPFIQHAVLRPTVVRKLCATLFKCWAHPIRTALNYRIISSVNWGLGCCTSSQVLNSYDHIINTPLFLIIASNCRTRISPDALC